MDKQLEGEEKVNALEARALLQAAILRLDRALNGDEINYNLTGFKTRVDLAVTHIKAMDISDSLAGFDNF